MATGNNAEAQPLHQKEQGWRLRPSELSERHVDCIDPNCDFKGKTFRVIRNHYETVHPGR